MNRVGFIIALLIFLVSCEEESSVFEQIQSLEGKKVNTEIEESKAKNDTTYQSTKWSFYEGRLGNYHQQFVLEIGQSSNQISGRYFLARHQKYIDLNGTIDTLSDTIRLVETHLGNITGYLTFKRDSNELNGYRQSTLEGPRQAFHAKPIQLELQNREQISVVFLKYTKDKTIEVYNSIESKTVQEKAVDELLLSKVDNKHFAFYYHVIGPNGHTGSVDGIATLVDKDYAIYKEDECMLSFRIFSDSIIVEEEEECTFNRGMHATFNNSLQKTTKQITDFQ